MVRELLLAEPRGFCAGVESAVKSLAWLAALNPPPVVCIHAVVHNEDVVARFEEFGVVFVNAPEEVPPGAAVLLSAHGSAPGTADRVGGARIVVDAVCPLVTKVHRELRTRSAAGDAIVYVGHRGHDETEGAVPHASGPVHVVESVTELDAVSVPPGGHIAVLAQTTIAVDDWMAVVHEARRRFGSTWTATRDDICFATTNRQAAVRALAASCDAVLVVGSARSSNTAALVTAARAAGAKEVHRVAGPHEVPALSVGRVGVTAGASTPARAVDAVVRSLSPVMTRTLHVTVEQEYFPLAPAIRRQIESAIAAGALPDVIVDAYRNDRHLDADGLLSLLEGNGMLSRRHRAEVA
jgi:4-hydroxy-3-methylbut-2-enyl diphosphate reductase